jgi:hypothetical protein
MKYKGSLLIICFFLWANFVIAQDNWLDQYPSRQSFGRANLSLSEIQGSPYLDSQYRVGTVLTGDNQTYKDIPLRYNCFIDVLEFKKNDASYELMPKELIKRAEFGGQVFSYKEYESGNGTSKSYFMLLAEGKATLCARYTIKFFEPEPVKGFADPVPARFADFDESYYVSIKDAPAKPVSNNKKLVEALSDKKNEIESFISKQKLSFKKAEDLKKIISYYNSL